MAVFSSGCQSYKDQNAVILQKKPFSEKIPTKTNTLLRHCGVVDFKFKQIPLSLTPEDKKIYFITNLKAPSRSYSQPCQTSYLKEDI